MFVQGTVSEAMTETVQDFLPKIIRADETLMK
jgi:hypothetical protein